MTPKTSAEKAIQERVADGIERLATVADWQFQASGREVRIRVEARHPEFGRTAEAVDIPITFSPTQMAQLVIIDEDEEGVVVNVEPLMALLGEVYRQAHGYLNEQVIQSALELERAAATTAYAGEDQGPAPEGYRSGGPPGGPQPPPPPSTGGSGLPPPPNPPQVPPRHAGGSGKLPAPPEGVATDSKGRAPGLREQLRVAAIAYVPQSNGERLQGYRHDPQYGWRKYGPAFSYAFCEEQMRPFLDYEQSPVVLSETPAAFAFPVRMTFVTQDGKFTGRDIYYRNLDAEGLVWWTEQDTEQAWYSGHDPKAL